MSAIVEKFLAENEQVEHDLQQGTPEWLAFRFDYDGASETAAALGVSKKTKRTELLHAKATGTPKEFSAWVQEHILDPGHEMEALARPIVEKKLGRSLYPVVCSRGRLSASSDGKTAAGDVLWEHKRYNKALFDSVANNILPEDHKPQCYQNLLVHGSEKLIFTVSDGTEENMVSMEVLPDVAEFERIILGWVQFHKDLADYVPPVVIAEAVAEPVKDLPAVTYEMNGMALTSNIATVVKPAVLAQIAKYEKKPETDQDFADLNAFTKSARESVKKSIVLRETVMAKIVDVDKFSRDLIELEELLTKAAISGEKVYKAENENRKNAIKAIGPARFAEHVAALQSEIVGVKLIIPSPDWVKAAYGLKSLKSLENAIDTCLANAKIGADAIARDVRAKLDWYNETTSIENGLYGFLFADLQQIISKPSDDFKLLVKTRISQHQQAEAAKLEAERERIRQEEEAKARAKAESEAKAKTEQEARAQAAFDSAKAAAEAERARAAQVADRIEKFQGTAVAVKTLRAGTATPAEISKFENMAADFEKQAADIFADTNHRSASVSGLRPTRPSDEQILSAIANHFGVTYGQVCDWVLEISEAMKAAA